MASVEDFIAEWHNSLPYVTAHTSGSTGKPKEIRLLKSDMRVSARATNEFFGIGPSSVLGLPLSPGYIAGKMMIVRALESGARLLKLPESNTLSIHEPVDLLAVVPSQLASLLEDPQAPSLVRNLLIGGAAPTEEICARLSEAGFRSYISYGMTETCSHVALAGADDSRRVYRAMPGISFETTEDDRLVIDCPRFSFGRLVTNDVVTLIDPQHFCWRGRVDGVINSGGIKYFPEELERLYAPYIPAPFYVCGIADDKWGTSICLVVEGSQELAAKSGALLREKIENHKMLPKRVVAVPSLPRTSNGKIKRTSPL